MCICKFDFSENFNVEFGYSYEMTRGKIVIIHNQDGLKVSCATIGSTLSDTVSSPAMMKKFPAYEGAYTPTLQAHMKFTDKAVTIEYNLTGVPCECAQIGTAPNSCGLHIHDGTSCSTASVVGGHWFNNMTIMSDPWAYAPYTARKCSDVCTSETNGTFASGSLTVMYGQDYTHTQSRVLVVHDYNGVKIGCAPLMGVPQISPESGLPFPLLPVVLGGSGFILLLLAFAYCRHRKRARVGGTLNEKLAPATAAAHQNPTRRTLSVNHM